MKNKQYFNIFKYFTAEIEKNLNFKRQISNFTFIAKNIEYLSMEDRRTLAVEKWLVSVNFKPNGGLEVSYSNIQCGQLNQKWCEKKKRK